MTKVRCVWCDRLNKECDQRLVFAAHIEEHIGDDLIEELKKYGDFHDKVKLCAFHMDVWLSLGTGIIDLRTLKKFINEVIAQHKKLLLKKSQSKVYEDEINRLGY